MKCEFKNHVIICNFPQEQKVIKIIKELGASSRYKNCKVVLISDTISELPEKLKKLGVFFVNGNPTDDATHLRANVLVCNGVIVLAQNTQDSISDERTFMICSIIKKIGTQNNVPIKMISEIVEHKNMGTIQDIKVDGLISEEGMASCLLVQEFMSPRD